MTDRELLELAAQAAKLEFDPTAKTAHGLMVVRDGAVCQSDLVLWNPLTDDGDALRLAVKLKMNVDICDSCAEVAIFVNDGCGVTTVECYNGDNDPYAATRRAITRAAAEIGKGMK